jgi:hypothetical protein
MNKSWKMNLKYNIRNPYGYVKHANNCVYTWWYDDGTGTVTTNGVFWIIADKNSMGF